MSLAGKGAKVALVNLKTSADGAKMDEIEKLELEDTLIAHYRAAVLSALWDVEIALSAIDHLNQATEAQAENLSQSEMALTAAQARYQAGSGDFLTVLDAQRTVISAREQMTQYKLARLQAAVGLCKALGGGWAQK